MLYRGDAEGRVVRTPMSGAWGGEKVLSGDLIPIWEDKIDYRFPIYWEVKRVKRDTISPFRLLAGDPGKLASWLKKAFKQTLENYLTVLLWKVDFGVWQVTMHMNDFEMFSESFGPLPHPRVVLSQHFRKDGYITMRLDDFKNWFDPNAFIGDMEQVVDIR